MYSTGYQIRLCYSRYNDAGAPDTFDVPPFKALHLTIRINQNKKTFNSLLITSSNLRRKCHYIFTGTLHLQEQFIRSVS